jgi:hypothetical protein
MQWQIKPEPADPKKWNEGMNVRQKEPNRHEYEKLYEHPVLRE